MSLRKSTAETVERLKKYLQSNAYVSALTVAVDLKVKPSAVYRAVRILRTQGVGIHPSQTGYVLSEIATKKDDVGLLRRVNGRRTSDYITISAAMPHIEKRWHSFPDKTHLRIALGGLLPSSKVLSKGCQVLNLLNKKKALLKK